MNLLNTLALAPLLLPPWMDPEYILTNLGNWALWGVALIIFAECGIFSILPGDSLLFAVGMFVSLGTITYGNHLATMGVVLPVLAVAAVLGNVSGYWIGRVVGPPLFKPRTSWIGQKLFNPVYVDKTHEFFTAYGAKALIIARFVPLVRTFVTLIAGVGKMPFRRFMTYTAIGGLIWSTGVTMLGYFLGQIPWVHTNFETAILLIVFVSILPMVWEFVQHRRQSAAQRP